MLLLIFFFIISGLHDYVHMADVVCTAELTEMPASAVLLSSVDLYCLVCDSALLIHSQLSDSSRKWSSQFFVFALEELQLLFL